jgi:hypothetical protein
VDEENDQIAHRRIVAGREILRNHGRSNNSPETPWQNPYVERLIGSIRRECLDHMIVWNERSLCRILQSYFHYYEGSRTHLALAKDAPVPRAVDQPENGRIEAISQVGGLHHRYQRRAA